MADIRVDVDIADDPRTRKLVRALGLQAFASLVFLKCWAGKHRTTGVLDGLDDEDLAEFARWKGKPARFRQALEDAGWLVQDAEGTVAFARWDEEQPFLADAAERSRKARESAKCRWNQKAGMRDASGPHADGNANGNARSGTSLSGTSRSDSNPSSSSPSQQPDEDEEEVRYEDQEYFEVFSIEFREAFDYDASRGDLRTLHALPYPWLRIAEACWALGLTHNDPEGRMIGQARAAIPLALRDCHNGSPVIWNGRPRSYESWAERLKERHGIDVEHVEEAEADS